MKNLPSKYRANRRIAALQKMCAVVLVWVCNMVCRNTPVLMASNSFAKSGKTYALAAAMPFMAMPIQEVPLLSWTLAHETVNEQNNLIASADEDLYLGLFNEDPYTSDQQRERDEYKLNDTDWYTVSFEQVDGTSKCHFALHDDWVKKQGYETEKVVILNLPEQGINGPFRVTAIKHIIPQKKPEGDAGDGYDWKPVTGLFEHQSDQVYNISFDNGEELGVTYQHPIFSTTVGDWKLSGELEIGEEVLTKSGNTKVVSSTKKEGLETVYNLEVKELHNFLVGESGIVVHNSYAEEVARFMNHLSKSARQSLIDDYWTKWFPEYFKRGRFYEELMRTVRYKNWSWTGDISNTFPVIDFFRKVAGKNVAASMKTTKTTSVQTWMTNPKNQAHLNALENGIGNGFTQGNNFVPADLVELHIYVPKANYSQAIEATWSAAIRAEYPGIKVVMSTIEKQVGL